MKVIIFCFFILSSCAYPVRKEAFKSKAPAKGRAVVYLYRTTTSIDALNPDIPRFFINNGRVGKLSLGGYYRTETDPGNVVVTYSNSFLGVPLPWSDGRVSFTASGDQTYYVKFGIDGMFRTEVFKVVPNEIGADEIQSTRLLVN